MTDNKIETAIMGYICLQLRPAQKLKAGHFSNALVSKVFIAEVIRQHGWLYLQDAAVDFAANGQVIVPSPDLNHMAFFGRSATKQLRPNSCS